MEKDITILSLFQMFKCLNPSNKQQTIIYMAAKGKQIQICIYIYIYPEGLDVFYSIQMQEQTQLQQNTALSKQDEGHSISVNNAEESRGTQLGLSFC